MNVLHFLADLTRDPDAQAAFCENPGLVMRQANLTEAQQRLLASKDAAKIAAELARELTAFVSESRDPWPPDDPEVQSVAPTSGAAGSTVRVRVAGNFFRPEATCSLHRGQERIDGRAEGIQAGKDAWIDVAFDLPAGAAAGAWDVVIWNDQDHRKALAASFEIQ